MADHPRQAGPRRLTDRPALAWIVYDWGHSAYGAVVHTFVIGVWFARDVWGDPQQGSAVWSWAIAAAGLGAALTAPVAGAIADRRGGRKAWVAGLTGLAALAAAGFWFVEPQRSSAPLALALVVAGGVAYELALVFYNALLSPNAPPGATGRLSGIGAGVGYVGGVACLGLALVGFVGIGPAGGWLAVRLGLGEEDGAAVRAVGPVVAVWLAVFALPLLVWSADPKGARPPLRRAVREGLADLRRTLAELVAAARGGRPAARSLLRFYVASALYRDGLATLFAVGGLYAAGTFGFSLRQALAFGVAVSVATGIGAAAFAPLDDRLGPKRTLAIALWGSIAIGLPLLVVRDPGLFVALGLGLGVLLGPIYAASRSLLVRLTDPAKAAGGFGLYALTGKSVAFAGPLLFGVLTEAFDSQRAGMAVVVVLFAAGALVLRGVAVPGRDG